MTVTIITMRGVSDASQLRPQDQQIFYRRLGGPGTRRKNPKLFDAEKRKREAAA